LHHLVHDGSVLFMSETRMAKANAYYGIIAIIIIILNVKYLVILWDIGEKC